MTRSREPIHLARRTPRLDEDPARHERRREAERLMVEISAAMVVALITILILRMCLHLLGSL